MTDERAADLAAALRALGMPPGGLRRWLESNKAFCARHGGRRHYADLLELYDACLALLDEPPR